MGTRKKLKEKKYKEESRKRVNHLANMDDLEWADHCKKKESKNKMTKPLRKVTTGLCGDRPCPEMQEMMNSVILDIGFPDKLKKDQQEGGLTIVYQKDNKIKRIVFGYTELGIWVYENKEIQKDK